MSNRPKPKCIVCSDRVNPKPSRKEVYIHPEGIRKGILKEAHMVVCTKKRCQRLVRETLAESGRKRVRFG